MPSTVERLNPGRVKITVEVPFTDLKPSMDKAYRQIAQSVNIPGFRRGKVPPLVIDQRFGRGAVISEALNDALPRFYGQAVEENELNPLAQPDVEVTRLEEGQAIEFTAEVDVRPEFQVPAFDSLSVTVEPIEVTDEMVEEQLERLRERFAEVETVERPAQEGDHVVIDLVARREGEVLDNASVEGQTYEVGSDSLVDGLDEALVGLSAGESRTFTSTIHPASGDVEAEVEVLLDKVQVRNLPALDDEFAQLASEFDTLDDLRDNIRSGLTSLGRLDQASSARDAVLADLINQIDFEVPEGILRAEIDNRHAEIERQLADAGLSVDAYLQQVEDGKDAETFWTEIDQRAKDALKAQIVLDKIAEDRQIEVDQSDLSSHILRRAQQERVNPQEIANHLQEHPHHVQEYAAEIRRGKALALLVEAATVTDSNGNPVDLANLRPDGSLPGEEPEDQAEELAEEWDDDEYEDDLDDEDDESALADTYPAHREAAESGDESKDQEAGQPPTA